MNKKQVVVVGGGTGTHTVLRGLRAYTDTIALSAIVSMADSGGSTGRLRDEFGQLPAGDVRNALTALAADGDAHDTLLRQLFMYRFDRGAGLAGHNFGNLFLTVLTDILGSEVAAIAAASRILRVAGRVIPVTTDDTHLVATYANGMTIVGEHAIETEQGIERITALTLNPMATISAEAKTALTEADLIIFGPGDLYTSVLANCIVGGFKEALGASRAKFVYICNLMSRPGQTTGLGSAEHVREITRYTGIVPGYMIYNTGPFPEALITKYAGEGTYPVLATGAGNTRTKLITGDFLAKEHITQPSGDVLQRCLIRHDSFKLAERLVSLLDLSQ
jgi:uncharacterized cofD-like protein